MFGQQAAERGVVFQALFKTRVTVVKMLILVATLFAISWAPYFALLLIEVSAVARLTDRGQERFLHPGGHPLRHLMGALLCPAAHRGKRCGSPH